MILHDMQPNGWKRLPPVSLTKVRCVPATRMGNIAGSWTADCRSEMKMATSSSGMGSPPTSKIANAPRRGYVKAKDIWRKHRDSVKLAVGHGTPRPVISDTG